MTILVVTNSDDPTVDFVEDRFRAIGLDHVRLDTDLVLQRMQHEFRVGGDADGERAVCRIDGVDINLLAVSAIWYRRPVSPLPNPELISEHSRQFAVDEAEYYLHCLWRALESRTWVSHPWAISWANTKLYQLQVAKDLGLEIPRSVATNDPVKARTFIESCRGRVVVKPFTANVIEYGKQDLATVYTSRVTQEDLKYLETVRHGITFLQEEIVKKQDLRVTVFGNDVFAASVDSQLDSNLEVDWRRMTSRTRTWRTHELPEQIAEKCRSLVSRLGLKFGAIDFAHTLEDEYVFFEINPNGQWAWLEMELGLPMTESLIRVLTQDVTMQGGASAPARRNNHA